MISVFLLGIIRNVLVNYHIDTFLTVKLRHPIHICSSIYKVLTVLNVKNSCYSYMLKSLDFLFVDWIWSKENVLILNLVEKEIIDEVSISFVNPTIDDPDLVSIQLEVWLFWSKLSSIIFRILNFYSIILTISIIIT